MDAVSEHDVMRAALAALCSLAAMLAIWLLALLLVGDASGLSAIFGGALVCVYLAVLAAVARPPDWVLVVATVAIAVPLIALADHVVPLLAAAVVIVAVAVAVGWAVDPWEHRELQPGLIGALAGAAALLLVATALASEPSRPAAAAPAAREVHRIAKPRSEPRTRRTGPAGFIRGYYAALSEKRFKLAWQRLAPAVREDFGGFGPWKAGFRHTLSRRLTVVSATRDGRSATVTLTLVATDAACGRRIRQRFTQTWALTRAGDTWQATGVEARKLSGPSPTGCV
jgi:hypothetical protein